VRFNIKDKPPLDTWHTWSAWHPVRVFNIEGADYTAWLEVVKRKAEYHRDYNQFYYRKPQ